MFPGETQKESFFRGFAATKQALVFGVVDSMIYGNWMYNVVTTIFLPNWVCLWYVAFSKSETINSDNNSENEKKRN